MSTVSYDRSSDESLERLIRQLGQRGVLLWVEGNVLRYRAPKGALTPEERTALSQARGEIVSILARDSPPGVATAIGRHPGTCRAPLSFTQLDRWHTSQEFGGRVVRQVALATRLQGPLRVDLLKESIAAVERRHDALRVRIVLEGARPMQEVVRHCSELEVIQLSAIPSTQRSAEIQRQIERAIVDGNDYATTPLFKAVLLAIEESEHALVLALDHIISDFVSSSILLEEILTAYAQLLNGDAVDLPSIATQYPDYAARLNAQSEDSFTGPVRRLNHIPRTRFPNDGCVHPSGVETDWDLVRFVISGELRDALRAWAKDHGSTIVLTTLTAYAGLVLRWCKVEETVIQFMIDGRTIDGLERTIGYFAFPLYVRVALDDESTFLDLLRRTTEEYCRAIDEADSGWAIAQVPVPEFTRNTGINWLPGVRATGGVVAACSPAALVWAPMEFSYPPLQLFESDHEPGVSFQEREEVIVGHVGYRRSRISRATMERFAANIVAFMTALLETPTARVADLDLR
jgi:hypothetical protein